MPAKGDIVQVDGDLAVYAGPALHADGSVLKDDDGNELASVYPFPPAQTVPAGSITSASDQGLGVVPPTDPAPADPVAVPAG